MEKIFPFAKGPQFTGSRMVAANVNARLPEGIRWSPVTRELLSVNVPIEDREPLTAADIGWDGLDQELGDETTLQIGAAILIEELTE